jgi:hypothetical protein
MLAQALLPPRYRDQQPEPPKGHQFQRGMGRDVECVKASG